MCSVYMYVRVYVRMCGGQRSASDVFFNATLFFEAGSLLLNLEFTVSPRLTCQQAPRVCLSLPLQFWSY